MRPRDFLLQQVSFVQEEDGGGLLEPRVREDGLEQGEALSQSVLQEARQEKRIIHGNNICFFAAGQKVTEKCSDGQRSNKKETDFEGFDLTSFSFS